MFKIPRSILLLPLLGLLLVASAAAEQEHGYGNRPRGVPLSSEYKLAD